MKKFIVLAVILFGGIIFFASCAVQKKCPAYGHTSQYELEQINPDQI